MILFEQVSTKTSIISAAGGDNSLNSASATFSIIETQSQKQTWRRWNIFKYLVNCNRKKRFVSEQKQIFALKVAHCELSAVILFLLPFLYRSYEQQCQRKFQILCMFAHMQPFQLFTIQGNKLQYRNLSNYLFKRKNQSKQTYT